VALGGSRDEAVGRVNEGKNRNESTKEESRRDEGENTN
jgi:hypothetical protein